MYGIRNERTDLVESMSAASGTSLRENIRTMHAECARRQCRVEELVLANNELQYVSTWGSTNP